MARNAGKCFVYVWNLHNKEWHHVGPSDSSTEEGKKCPRSGDGRMAYRLKREKKRTVEPGLARC